MYQIHRLVISILVLLALSSCQKNEQADASLSKNKTFVVVGSSTAFGTGASIADSSWVVKLANRLNADSKNIKVVNLALGGLTTYHVLPSNAPNPLQRPIPDTTRNITQALSFKPDFIIISLPTNDVAQGYTSDESLLNYKRITGAIQQTNTAFLITSTQPRNLSELSERKRLKDFNLLLKAAYPSNVIDYFDILADSQYLIKPSVSAGDGVHLNNTGHRLIYEEFFKNKLFLGMAGY